MKNSVLTILQVLIFIYVVLISGPFFVLSIPFVIIQIIGILLIVWSLLVKRISRRKLILSSRKDSYLIKEGPYEFIRHPIDLGLLLFVFTYVQDYITLGRFLGVVLFIVLMVIKIVDDEKNKTAKFKKEYTEYKNNTKCLIPYIY